MRKNHQVKKAPESVAFTGKLKSVPLDQIEPPPNNTRKQINSAKLKGLTASIRQQGVLQPILLREIKAANGTSAKYQIIAGERRFHAAKEAGLKEIPANIRTMDEAQALGANLTENLQREDVHPLDEADGLLRMKEELKLELRDIAQRVAKDARYVARRLSLTNLIEEAREDFRKEHITLAHALEICRLMPEIQPHALAACYESTTVFNRKEKTHEQVPDKNRPARHVRYLQEWIARNVHLNLQQAPFKLDDARLREDGLTCLNCPQRTGHNKTLFADIKNGDICLDPICYQRKLKSFVQLRKAELEDKNNKPVVLISTYYGGNTEDEGVIGRDQFEIVERKADRCEFAEQAVCANGNELGQVKWICREKSCKDHLGRIPEYHSYSTHTTSRTTSPEAHYKRKQELFDIKVDEVVRKRVMQEAIKTYSWPLDRAHLDEAIKEFFRRIPAEHQKTIGEVFGWEEKEADKLRFDEKALLRALAQFDEHRLAQFLMLCSFAHYGANQYKSNQVDQRAVVKLSQERGINHALIDAEVRVELCAKKYKPAHQAYLEAVQNGRAAKKPVVYEKPQPTSVAEVDEGKVG